MPPLDILSITPRLEYISDLIQGQRVLSLGGFGWDAYVACTLGAQEALYVDPRPHRVRYAEGRAPHPKAMAIEGRWDDLPLEDSCIDVVLMTGLPLDTRERRYALSEARRVLTPDGFLFLTLENTGPIRLGGRLLNPSRIPSSPSLRSDLRRQFPQVEFLHQRVDLGVTITPSAQAQARPSYVNHQGEPPPLSIAICSRLMILPTEVGLSLGGLESLTSHAMAHLKRRAAIQAPQAPNPEREDLSEALKEAKDALKAMELDLQVALDDAHQLRTRLQNLGLGAPSLTPGQSAGKETLKEALLGDLLDEAPIRVITSPTPIIDRALPENDSEGIPAPDDTSPLKAPEALEPGNLNEGAPEGTGWSQGEETSAPHGLEAVAPIPHLGVDPTHDDADAIPGASDSVESAITDVEDSAGSPDPESARSLDPEDDPDHPKGDAALSGALASEDRPTLEAESAFEHTNDGAADGAEALEASEDTVEALADLLHTTAERRVPEWSVAETQAIDREELATEVTEPIVTQPLTTETDGSDPVDIPDLATLPEVTAPPSADSTPEPSEEASASGPTTPLRLSPMGQWKEEGEGEADKEQSLLEDELDASIARALRGEDSGAEVPEPSEGTETQASASEDPSGEISELKEALEAQQRRLDEIQATLLAQGSKDGTPEEAPLPEGPKESDTAHWPGSSALPLAMPSLFDSLGDGEGGGLERPQDGELALLAAITPENLSKLPQVVQTEDDD